MPVFSPHTGFVHTPRQQCLRRRAHALPLSEHLEKIRRSSPVEERRVESARCPLECGDGAVNLLEHAPPPGLDTAGEASGK
jgi:hypothetical protein